MSLTKSMYFGRDEDEFDGKQAASSMFSLLRIIRLINRFTNRLSVMRNASLDYDDLSTSEDVMTSTRCIDKKFNHSNNRLFSDIYLIY